MRLECLSKNFRKKFKNIKKRKLQALTKLLVLFILGMTKNMKAMLRNSQVMLLIYLYKSNIYIQIPCTWMCSPPQDKWKLKLSE